MNQGKMAFVAVLFVLFFVVVACGPTPAPTLPEISDFEDSQGFTVVTLAKFGFADSTIVVVIPPEKFERLLPVLYCVVLPQGIDCYPIEPELARKTFQER